MYPSLETNRLYNRVAQEERAEFSRDFSLRPTSTASNRKGRRGKKEREREGGREDVKTNDTGLGSLETRWRRGQPRPGATSLACIGTRTGKERVIEVAEAIPGRAGQETCLERQLTGSAMPSGPAPLQLDMTLCPPRSTSLRDRGPLLPSSSPVLFRLVRVHTSLAADWQATRSQKKMILRCTCRWEITVPDRTRVGIFPSPNNNNS